MSLREIISECCVCHKLKFKDQEHWFNPTEEYREEVYKTYDISHGYCSKCYDDFLRENKLGKYMSNSSTYVIL